MLSAVFKLSLQVTQQIAEVKGQVTEVKGQVTEVKGQVDRQGRDLQHVVSLADGNKNLSQTKHTRATRLQKQVEEKTVSSNLPSVFGEPAVLTADQQVEASRLAKMKEKYFVAYMLPKLEELFVDTSRVVVDSQNFPWLDPGFGGALLKPDAFITHRGMYAARTSHAAASVGGESASGPRCGIPADSRFHADDVDPIEGKSGATIEGQLELVDYLNLKGDGCSSGMLIGHDQFWLIEAHKLYITKRVVGKWTDGGSASAICDFFRPSKWIQAINGVCSELNCTIAEGSPDSLTTIPFLGAGSFGRVFRLDLCIDGDATAVKVVLPSNSRALQQEYQLLAAIFAANEAAPVVRVSRFVSGDTGAGYVLAPIGMVVASETKVNVAQVFAVMQQLHSSGFVHGDARLSNLIRHKRSLLWIDFVGGRRCSTAMEKQSDCMQLACSVLHHYGILSLASAALTDVDDGKYAAVSSAISSYSSDVGDIVREIHNVIHASSASASQ